VHFSEASGFIWITSCCTVIIIHLAAFIRHHCKGFSYSSNIFVLITVFGINSVYYCEFLWGNFRAGADYATCAKEIMSQRGNKCRNICIKRMWLLKTGVKELVIVAVESHANCYCPPCSCVLTPVTLSLLGLNILLRTLCMLKVRS
jgi:hypothetical protein